MQVIGDFKRDGHAHVQGLLPREVCNAFLRQLQEGMARSGVQLNQITKESVILKRGAPELYGYDYPPMLTLLWGLTPTISALAGRDLLPTYSYLRLYREGDICRVHSDRPSCEVSLSLTLDYSDGVPWPLEVSERRADVSQLEIEDGFDGPCRGWAMEPGDGVIYDGVHLRHGRTQPNPNGWSAHLFLHWVERDGRYASHAFDRNRDLGKPVNFTFG
ncbi:hypothetical protein FPZ54_05635 [Sphingomonas suaedae]|uniref:Fe2OG dioxygenase domain-containing protein n=2 Tax=Sphingomonas suaedae TaxID=2599297 RepID=A0A518RDM9_9SPHN|nr:hypothetical protein FPZ54_05635 [Sphingomonas suaedae]